MALFSRGAKRPAPDTAAEAVTPEPVAPDAAGAQGAVSAPGTAGASDMPGLDATAGAASDGAASSAAPADVDGGAAASAPAPQVGISTTSFGGFGAVVPPAAPVVVDGRAPDVQETIPGLPDNVVLRATLAALGADPEPHEILGVARQLLQGNVYLRVKGDAQELMRTGADLPLAIATRDEGQFVMLYSAGETLAAAVAADGDTETSAMGQAGSAVLQYVLSGEFAGVIVDHASEPASVVLPRMLIERMVEEMDPALTLKRLVAGPRTTETAAAVGAALASSPIWIAVNRAGDDDEWGVAESHLEDGTRVLPVFSHPLEVIALGRGDRPMPFTPAQLGSALRGDTGIDGVVVDAAGPWIRLGRADLAPVLALPEPEPDPGVDSEPGPGAEPGSESEATADPDPEPAPGSGAAPTVGDRHDGPAEPDASHESAEPGTFGGRAEPGASA